MQKSFLVLILVLTLVVALGLVAGAESEAIVKVEGNPVLGTWMLGMVSGAEFDSATGQYLGGASGMGQLYLFRDDGTYQALVTWMETMYFEGNYAVKGDVLELTKRVVKESTDLGKTWSGSESLPDASTFFLLGRDEVGAYLLLGGEGAEPPLVDKTNAARYRIVP